jgi:DNA topoisomerase-1
VSVSNPPKPLITSTLQQEASVIHGLAPKTTMMAAQKLYEAGHITYMRTENTKYSPVFLDQARRYIETVYQDPKYLGDLDVIENKDANNPHEAIRCTNISLKELSADLNPKVKSMYTLIWRNTLESCMSHAQYKTQCASVSAPQKHIYQRILEIPVFLGWKKVGLERVGALLGSDKDPLGSDKKPLGSDKKPLDDDSATLFYLQSQKGAIMSYTHIESKIQIRGKKTHYTESGLIQELEELGIGRPSTFSLLVDTVQDRGYVKCQDIPGIEKECTEFVLQCGGVLDKQIIKKELGGEKHKLRIQPVGTLCIEFLIEHFGPLFSYNYTKDMEEQLDSIAKHDDVLDALENNICLSCDQTIDALSKTLSTMKRQEIVIDSSHVFIMTRQGPAIRDNDGAYLSINPDLNLDIDRLKTGEYTLDNLVLSKCRELGVYQDSTLYLKTGKFGPYLEWSKGTKKQSTRTLDSTSTDKITLEIATAFLDNIEETRVDEGSNKRDAPTATSILRAIDTDTSIRQGKFGPYIFYKTATMKKPQFVALRGFKGDWKTCVAKTITDWVHHSKK